MSEVWLRLLVVVAAVVISAVVVVGLRHRRPNLVETESHGLDPGVYLFTSTTCADCEPARARLEEALGVAGFVEIEWEQRPGLFSDIGIDVVPCTLVVTGDGSASRFPGLPDKALETLNP